MKALPPSLYQITAELSALEEALEQDTLSPDLNPELMKNLVVAVQEKSDAIVGFQNYLDDQVGMIDLRLKELAAYKAGILKKMDRLDQYVAACLKQLGTSKLEGKLSTISRRAPTDVVVITDENALPMEFLRTVVEPKKTDIKNAIKAGQDVPGAKLEKSQTISMTYKNRRALTKKEASGEEEA